VLSVIFLCGTKEIGGGKHTGTADGRICKYLPRDFPGQITPDLPRIFLQKKKVVPTRKHKQFLQILPIKLAKMGFRACIAKLGSFRGGPPCVKFANCPNKSCSSGGLLYVHTCIYTCTSGVLLCRVAYR
jgi:hypothetical protein